MPQLKISRSGLEDRSQVVPSQRPASTPSSSPTLDPVDSNRPASEQTTAPAELDHAPSHRSPLATMLVDPDHLAVIDANNTALRSPGLVGGGHKVEIRDSEQATGAEDVPDSPALRSLHPHLEELLRRALAAGAEGRLHELLCLPGDPGRWHVDLWSPRQAGGRDQVLVVLSPAERDAPGGTAAGGEVRLDALTGLPTREALCRFEAAFREAGAPWQRLAVFFVDLDHFKHVNDTWGHLTGDRVLLELAERLRASVRPSDLVVRFGGDELLIVMDQVGGADHARHIARRLSETLSAPVAVGEHAIRVTASIGVACGGQHVAELDDLIELADQAMYRAKAVGRGQSAT